MLDNIRIIVLHTIKYKETGIIIQGYSDRGGRESFFLRGGNKRGKGSILPQLHPLSIIEATPSSFTLGEMTSIKEIFLPHKLESIRSNIFKSSIAIFISELIYKTIREVEHNREMFLFLNSAILRLESMERGISNFHPYFTVMLCKHLGYLPDIKNISAGQMFDIPSASFTTVRGELSFDTVNSTLLTTFAISDYDNISEIKMTGLGRNLFIKELLRYLGFHAGHGIEIDSLDVLHEVFE